MKLRLSILFLAAAALAAASASGQTVKSLGYNTTNGNIVAATNVIFTNSVGFATNARATTRTNLGLGASDSVVFSNLSLSGNGSLAIGGMNLTAISSGIDLAFKRAGSTELELKTNGLILHVGSYSFSGGNTNGASTTRTNLGLGGTSTVTFSNIQLNSFPSGGSTGFVGHNSGQLALYGTNVSTSVPAFYGWSGFESTAFSAATARTNLELGATNSVTFSNVTASGTLTATGNATLNGSDNLMPNATTASSASSLMTRGLLPTATGNEPSFGPTFSFSTATTNSATAGVRLVSGVSAQTGSSTNGRSCAAIGEAFWTFSAFSGAAMPANKAIDLYLHGVTFAVATNTNWVSRIIFGQGSSSSARVPAAAGADAVTNRSWGVEFFYNGTNQVFRPFWHDGTNLAAASPQAMPLSGSTQMAAVKLSQTGTGDISVTMATSTASRIPDSPTWSTNVASFNAGNYAGQSIFIEAAGNTNQAQTGSGTGILSRAQYIRYVP